MIAKLQAIKNHKGFVKYFKNTSLLFAEKILRLVVGVFIGVWVARYLGPEQFGLLSYAVSFVGLFATFATFGLDGIIVRELVKDESKKNMLLGTAFVLKFIGALLVLFILSVAVNVTTNNQQTNILIFIIASAIVFQSFNVIDFFFQAKVLSKYVVYTRAISLIFSSIIKILLILNEASLICFAYVILFDNLVLAIGYITYYRIRNFSLRNWRFDKMLTKSLLADSWPLILSGIVISIYMKIDQVMIKEMLGSEAVGQYAAAVRLSEPWYFIPLVIASSLFPAIINAKQKSEKLYYMRLQRLYNLMVLMAICIAFPMTFLSDWIIMLLYGIEYSKSGSVLMIHIWASVFVFLGVASSKWFIVEDKQMLSFYRTFSGMLTNIVLNFVLIPKFGISGAAIATLISQVIAAYFFDVFNMETRVLFVMKTKALFFISIFKQN